MRRELGYIETLCAIGQDELPGAVQGVAVVEVAGPLAPEQVAAALERLQARHPLLRARIERGQGGDMFVVEDAPALAFTWRPRGSEDTTSSLAESEAGRAIDARAPLWRVTLLHGEPHLLALAYHLAIVDAAAALRFFAELLQLCDDELPARPMPRAIEETLARGVTWAAYQAAVQADGAGRPALAPWPYVRPALLGERRACTIHAVVEAALVDRLQRRAAEEGVSVAGTLAAAMLRAAASLAPGPISLGTSVDLRGYVSGISEDIDCGMINVRTAYDRSDGDLWQLARAHDEQLAARTPAQGFTPVGFDPAVLRGKLDRSALEAATRFPFHLGLCELECVAPSSGPRRIVRAHVGTSMRAGLYAGFMHAVTIDGCMHLDFAYAEPLLAGAWARSFVAAFNKQLAGV